MVRGEVMNNKIEPLVSIIIPLYNAEKYIDNTLKSVLKQKYCNYEVLIVNDGPTDTRIEIVSKYVEMDKRFYLLNLEINKGVSNARNIGIRQAKGEYIAFLDSDDLWTNDKLTVQINYMLENNYSFSCTSYKMFKDDNINSGKIINPEKEITYNSLLCGNQIACFTVVVKKDLLGNCLFSEYKHEDYLLWLELTKKGHVCHNINKVLGYYRRSINSLSGNKIKASIWTWNVLYRYQNLSFFEAAWYFKSYIINGIKKHKSI